MSDDLIFGVRMDGEGNLAGEAKAARGEIDKLKKSTDELGASAQRTAAQTKSYWQEEQRLANARAQAWLKGSAEADIANDKAWALANGYKQVGNSIVKSGADSAGAMERLGLNTQYARREMLQLGKETVSGDFGRMPQTFMSLVTHSNLWKLALSPIGLMIGGITAAAVAGGIAWYNWGRSAEEALNRATAAAKESEAAAKAAMAGVIQTDEEKLADLQGKIDGAQGLLDWALKRRSEITAQTSSSEALQIGKDVLERRKELAALQRQVDQVQASMAAHDEKIAKKTGGETAKRLKEEREAQLKAYVEAFNERIRLADEAHEAEVRNSVYLMNLKTSAAEQEREAAEKFAAQQKKDYEELNRTLTDALMRGFESGSSFARNFVNTVQNLFNTLVLRPVVSAIMSPVSSAISAGAGSLGLSNVAGASGLIGAEIGGYSAAQGALYYQGGGTISGAFAGSTSAGLGATAAAVAPYAAAAAAAYVIAKYGFGWGNERENVGPQRLAGTFDRGGFTGNYAQDWKVEGGWFGGGSGGTDLIPLTAAQSAAFKSTVNELQKIYDALGDTIGDTAIKTQQWSVKVNQAGDVTAALADGIGSQLIPVLQDLRAEGENLAQTAQRVTGSYAATTQLIYGLGLGEAEAFGAIGIASAESRLALIDAAGGLQNFSALAGQFTTGILDQSQRTQISLNTVADTFARLNISGIETNKQFSDLVASELQLGNYDVVTKLLGVSAAFAEVTRSAEETTAQVIAMIRTDTFATMVDYQRAVGRARNAGGAGNSPLDLAVASSAAMLPRLQAANDATEEIRALRREMAGLRLTSEENARYSRRIADLLRRVTRDGESLITSPA